MGGAKPWQIILFAVAAIVFAGSMAYSCAGGDDVEQADSATMVDVTTGELFIAPFPERLAIMWPQKNPDTKVEALYSVQPADGGWFLDTRFLPDIKARTDIKPEAVKDWRTGEMTVKTPTPRKADIFSQK